MRVIIVDDEQLAVDRLVNLISEVEPQAGVRGFLSPAKALEDLMQEPADVAFLDIRMYGMGGLELAKRMKAICPHVNVIFVTGYSEYSIEAFSLRASGYLIKPVTAQDVRQELDHLRYAPPDLRSDRLKIQTFGNFEVYMDGQPLHFSRAKAKELFAYLVDRRGTSSTMAEIAAVLWEDREYDRSLLKQIHTYLAEIRKLLESVNAGDVLIKQHNSIAINVEAVDCDYYRFLQGDVAAINSFTNEYMGNYSWAEFTVGSLFRIAQNQDEKQPVC